MPQVSSSDPALRRPSPLTVVVVIPARLASTRLPNKPLVDIAGRPLIEHVYRRAVETPGVERVIVATDAPAIAAAIERCGGVAQLTDPSHQSGTDRVAEVARGLSCDIVVNVQGDLPLIDPRLIAEVIAPLVEDGDLVMATARKAITTEEEWRNPNIVKVVADCAGDALYFSRAPLPYRRHSEARSAGRYGDRHIGLYGYRREFLMKLATLTPTPLEISESLEQLRVLEHGFRIRTVETQYDSIEVDTPEDLDRVRRHFASLVAAPRQDIAVTTGSRT